MRRRRRGGMDLNGEINVVSLIDVMMLLMVIFMIAAPMMQSGIDVSLPKADAPSVESKSALTVSIDKRGAIYVDNVKISDADFRKTIKALATRKGKDGVYLQGDESISYGRIAQIVSILQENGITNVSMLMVPVTDNKP